MDDFGATRFQRALIMGIIHELKFGGRDLCRGAVDSRFARAQCPAFSTGGHQDAICLPKPSFEPSGVCSVRTCRQNADQKRGVALFNLARSKTVAPVPFEVSSQTPQAAEKWQLFKCRPRPLFPSRKNRNRHIAARLYDRIVDRSREGRAHLGPLSQPNPKRRGSSDLSVVSLAGVGSLPSA